MTTDYKEEEQKKENVIDNLDQSVSLADLKALMAKKKEASMPPKIVQKKTRSLKFGIVGSGQAGGRIASEFFKLGYPAVAFNTAPQDLEPLEIPPDNKFILEFGVGGAAKDTSIGAQAAEMHRDAITALVDDKLQEADLFIFAVSLGGGSGAGSVDTIVEVLTATQKPVVVVTVLPMASDDAQTKENSLKTLAKLGALAQNKVISNIIVVDNAKLEAIFSEVSHMNFFEVGNKAIVEPVDVFNTFSKMTSSEKALDSMEFAKLFIDGEGFCIYGGMTVSDYQSDPLAIARAVVENFDQGLLASGFDIASAKYAGCMIIANSRVWSQISRGSTDMVIELIRDQATGVETIFRGSYIDDSLEEDVVKVYSMFSGLGFPEGRVSQLRKDVDADKVRIQERAKARTTNLTIDIGKDKVVSKADEIKQQLVKSNSKFLKNFANLNKDRR